MIIKNKHQDFIEMKHTNIRWMSRFTRKPPLHLHLKQKPSKTKTLQQYAPHNARATAVTCGGCVMTVAFGSLTTAITSSDLRQREHV